MTLKGHHALFQNTCHGVVVLFLVSYNSFTWLDLGLDFSEPEATNNQRVIGRRKKTRCSVPDAQYCICTRVLCIWYRRRCRFLLHEATACSVVCCRPDWLAAVVTTVHNSVNYTLLYAQCWCVLWSVYSTLNLTVVSRRLMLAVCWSVVGVNLTTCNSDWWIVDPLTIHWTITVSQ